MARKKGGQIDTRGALIEAAWALFQLHGYDGTSVDAIVQRASLSKGTFFHYFATKTDLLEAVCDHVSAPPWAAVADQVADRSRPAPARLRLLLEAMREWRIRHSGFLVDLYRALARPENTLLLVRLAARQDQALHRALVEILEDGNRAGAFSVPDAEEMAGLVCAVVRSAGDRSLQQVAAAGTPGDPRLRAAVARRGNTAAIAIERMLEMPARSLRRASAATLNTPRSRGTGRTP